MGIRWIDKSLVKIIQDMSKDCHFNERQWLSKDEHPLNTIHIICSGNVDWKLFYGQLCRLSDNFKSIHIALGYVDTTLAETGFPEGAATTIFIGDHESQGHFLKISDQSQCVVSPFISQGHINLGYQRQHNSGRLSQKSDISLGHLINNIKVAEPTLREVNSLFFDLAAIRRSDTGLPDGFLTGLNIYEACKIARYAGFAHNLGLYHINLNNATASQPFEAAALLSWYFIEGFVSNIEESAVDPSNNVFYINSHYLEKPITFVEGHKSGRWWIQDPYNDQAYIPCTRNDYEQMRKGHIPDRYLSLIID